MHAVTADGNAFTACCAAWQVNYKEPTPPDANLVVRSAVVKIRDTADIGSGKTSVQVDLALCLEQPAGQEKLLASATGIFKKLGALRAL
jgi:hypothetical protein